MSRRDGSRIPSIRSAFSKRGSVGAHRNVMSRYSPKLFHSPAKTPEEPIFQSIDRESSCTPDLPRFGGIYAPDYLASPSQRLEADPEVYRPEPLRLPERFPPELLSLLFRKKSISLNQRNIFLNCLCTGHAVTEIREIIGLIQLERGFASGSLQKHKHAAFLYTRERNSLRIYFPVDQILKAEVGCNYPIPIDALGFLADEWLLESRDKVVEGVNSPVFTIPPGLEVNLHVSRVALEYELAKDNYYLTDARLVYSSINIGPHAICFENMNGVELNREHQAANNLFLEKELCSKVSQVPSGNMEPFSETIQDLKSLPLILSCEHDSEDESLLKFLLVNEGDRSRCFGSQIIYYKKIAELNDFQLKCRPEGRDKDIILNETVSETVFEAITYAINCGHDNISLQRNFYLSQEQREQIRLVKSRFETLTITRSLLILLINEVPVQHISRTLFSQLLKSNYCSTADLSAGAFVKAIKSATQLIVSHTSRRDFVSKTIASLADTAENEIIESALNYT